MEEEKYSTKTKIIIAIILIAVSVLCWIIFVHNNDEKANESLIQSSFSNSKLSGVVTYQPYILNVPDGQETVYFGKKYANYSGGIISSDLETHNILYPKGHLKENLKDVEIEFQIDKGNNHYSFKGNATLWRYLESQFDLNFSDERIAIFPSQSINFTWTYSNTYTNEIEERVISEDDEGNKEIVNISYKKYTNYQPLTKPMQNAIRGGIGDYYLDPTLSSCGTLSSGGVYVQNQSISGGTNCLVIGASNVEIDCAGYSITYGTTGAGHGVLDDTGYDNLTVRNCNQIVLAGNRLDSNAISLDGDNTDVYNTIVIVNNTINTTLATTQTSCRCFIITSNATNVDFSNNTCYNNQRTVGVAIAIVDANTRKINVSIRNNFISGGTFGINYNNVFGGGIIDNNTFYNTNNKDGFSLQIGYNNNQTIVSNNKLYYGNNLTSGGIWFNSKSINNVSIFNNYFEQFNYSIATYSIEVFNITIDGAIFYNNTFNASLYYLNASNRYNSWNTTIGNYYTNASGTGYSDTCAVTITNYVCDIPYNLTSVNNTDYLPISLKTTGGQPIPPCWTRYATYLYVPTGCVYNVSTGVVG